VRIEDGAGDSSDDDDDDERKKEEGGEKEEEEEEEDKDEDEGGGGVSKLPPPPPLGQRAEGESHAQFVITAAMLRSVGTCMEAMECLVSSLGFNRAGGGLQVRRWVGLGGEEGG
jgi:hypothetical protein